MRTVLLSGFGVAACGGLTGTRAQDGDAAAEASASPDASSTADARACVTIDVATFDRSCTADGDCVSISAGTICDGYNCLCGGATINASGQARYDAELATVHPGTGPFCDCPYLGRPRCIQQQCVYCTSFNPTAPGCPDGG